MEGRGVGLLLTAPARHAEPPTTPPAAVALHGIIDIEQVGMPAERPQQRMPHPAQLVDPAGTVLEVIALAVLPVHRRVEFVQWHPLIVDDIRERLLDQIQRLADLGDVPALRPQLGRSQ